MKLNKKLIGITCIVLCFSTIALYNFFLKNSDSGDESDKITVLSENKKADIQLPELPDDMYYMDKISYVVQMDEYQKGDINYRVNIMSKLLDKMIEEKVVSGYNVDLQNSNPHIVFQLCSGGESMIMLTKFRESQN